MLRLQTPMDGILTAQIELLFRTLPSGTQTVCRISGRSHHNLQVSKCLPDCVSFKPNSTNIVVQNLNCTGSHGISVGSLGQYKDKVDIVENVYTYNISMTHASDGARIKVWPGVQTDFQTHLKGGGGLGRVKNITWDTIYHDNNDKAISISQCYGQSNQTLCYEFPVRNQGLRFVGVTADPSSSPT